MNPTPIFTSLPHDSVPDTGIADVSTMNTINMINSEQNMYSPVIVFTLISFFSLIGAIIYRSLIAHIPSVCTIGTELIFMIISLALLIVIGSINVTAEWICMIILSLCVLLSIYVIIVPEVFFFPKLS